tara:strand:- start:5556 stop:6347 length:792 start_codon:yes stop_codon:yes gene_type:complete
LTATHTAATRGLTACITEALHCLAMAVTAMKFLRRISMEGAMEMPQKDVLQPGAISVSPVFSNLFLQRFRACKYRAVHRALALICLLFVPAYSLATVAIQYHYDDLNRLTGVVRGGPGSAVHYRYDEGSNLKWIASGDSPDTDSDGTPNFVDTDDDNDGISDPVEIAAGLNHLVAGDAAGDLDGDGISNLQEYLQQSDINHFHGDLDSDNDLDLGDIVVLKRIIFGHVAATQEQRESGHGDVNMDGRLDVGDLVILRRLHFRY